MEEKNRRFILQLEGGLNLIVGLSFLLPSGQLCFLFDDFWNEIDFLKLKYEGQNPLKYFHS